MAISPEKSRRVVIAGQDTVRCKILVNNKCLQQVNNFQYVGCEISRDSGTHMQQKLVKFVQILVIRNGALKPTVEPRYFQE